MITYSKLKDGSWGVRVDGESVSPGMTVTVIKRNGSSKVEVLGSMVWNGGQVKLYSIRDSSSKPSQKRQRQRRSEKTEGVTDGKYSSVSYDSREIGEILYLRGAHKDRIPVTVIGYKGEYVSEDGLSFGYPDDEGYFYTNYYRDATPEEAKALSEKDAARAAAAKAAQEAKENAIKSGKEAYEAAVQGLVKTTCLPKVASSSPNREKVVSYNDRGSDISLYRLGDEGFVAYHNSYDDYRSYFYGSQEVVSEAVKAWAESVSLTPERARDWLDKYRGCEGTSDYEIIAAL